jgi:hypothetical protein
MQDQAHKLLTGAERFWYAAMNIAFGAGYFAKIPVKKAAAELGNIELTGAESFWYAFMNVAFGAGYFAKVIAKVALAEARP